MMVSLLGSKNGQTSERSIKMRNDSWIQIGIYAVAAVILFGMVGWYTYFVWSDCLGENSVLTCMRMLGR